MKTILLVFAAAIMFASCSKQAKQTFATEQGKKGRGNNLSGESVLGTTATITITNNGGGSFGIDYGGATDVVWTFFRGGDTLSVSGNVIPQNSLSFYLNPVSTITSTFTRTFYQAVVVTGTTEKDINGVVGADWVFNYSNVVQ